MRPDGLTRLPSLPAIVLDLLSIRVQYLLSQLADRRYGLAGRRFIVNRKWPAAIIEPPLRATSSVVMHEHHTSCTRNIIGVSDIFKLSSRVSRQIAEHQCSRETRRGDSMSGEFVSAQAAAGE